MGAHRPMRKWLAISAAGVMALSPLSAAFAQVYEVILPVTPHRAHDSSAAPASGPSGDGFQSKMDRVFGPGGWRETSGYRSEAREDELRREGAGTVPAGQISHHSMGSPDAPGAYDVVVPGMSTEGAAAKLRDSGETFSRVLAERSHGSQGSHLHIEPGFVSDQVSTSRPNSKAEATADPGDGIYLRVVGGRRNPVIARESRASGPRIIHLH